MKDGKPWRVRKAEMEAAAEKARAEMIRKPAKTWPKVPVGHNPHKPRGIIPWTPGKIWDGEIVIIVGGGPTLKEQTHLDALAKTKGHKTIAINNAYEDIAPHADMLFFADCQWWRWNKEKVTTTWPKDRLLVTSTSDTTHVNEIAAGRPLKRCWRSRNGWSTDPAEVFGYDGGTQAVNMAAHLGAKRIVLFGIDLKPGPKGETQYHNKHKRKTAVANYTMKFIPTMVEAVKQCRAMGITVLRATPGVDIGAPLVDIELALKPDEIDPGCVDVWPLSSSG